MKNVLWMVLLVSASAAGQTPPEDAAQNGLKSSPNMGPTEFGDPMKISDTTVLHTATDFTIQTSLGPFSFKRTYYGNQFTWSAGHSLIQDKVPFGRHPLRPESIEWAHNLFSFVAEVIPLGLHGVHGPSSAVVRDTGGRLVRFDDFPINHGAVLEAAGQDTSGVRLFREGPNRFVLVRPGEGRFIYTHHVGNLWFLTEIDGDYYSTTGTSGPALATITYSNMGIDSVDLVDGQSLTFHYNPNYLGPPFGFHTNTLDYITLEPKFQGVTHTPGSSPGGGHTNKPQAEKIVQYQYVGGRLTGATNPQSGRDETYSYGTPAAPVFEAKANSRLMTRKTLRPAIVSTSIWTTDADETLSRTIAVLPNTPMIALADPDCARVATAHGPDCDNNWRTWLQSFGREGDGSAGFVNLETRQLYLPRADQTGKQVEVCTKQSGGSCLAFQALPSQKQVALWGYLSETSTELESYLDRNGSLTAYAWAQPTLADTLFYEQELRQVQFGLAVGGVGPAARTVNYAYAYGGASRSHRFYEKQQTVETEASVVPGCATVTTTKKYDPVTNKLVSVVRTGCTRLITNATQGSPVQLGVGTFYFSRHRCENSNVVDPLGRTLEIHGPCRPTGPVGNPIDCSAGYPAPITQFEYWPGSEKSERANRLKRKSMFTDNQGGQCVGAHRLDTFFDEYDARGHVLEERDANGVITTRHYTGDQLDSESTAGATTTYTYDAVTKQPASVRHPAGNYEVFCYRLGTTVGACTGGIPFDKLVWKSRSGTSTGNAQDEHVEYDYENGNLRQEKYFEQGGNFVRFKRYQADPLNRPTYEQWGAGAGSYSSAQLFDAENQPVKVGQPYNHPGGLCNPVLFGNEECTVLTRDRLGRVSRSDIQLAVGTAGTDSVFFDYDSQGNPKSVGGGPGLPPSPYVTYEHDDFGNVIAVAGVWMGPEDSSPPPKVLQEFDARGNLVKRATPAGAPQGLTWMYDNLSRVREARAEPNLLWANTYDAEAAVPVLSDN